MSVQPQIEKLKPGMRYGRLVIEGESRKVDTKYGPRRKTPCICDCGNRLEVWSAALIEENTKSCGCFRKEVSKERATTHGHRRDSPYSRLYEIWIGMRYRCQNPKRKAYVNYGARGIKVCPEWNLNFTTFLEWAKQSGYRDDLTIERKDVNGNYEPDNCTWIPLGDQAYNKTNSNRITAFGETKTLSEWLLDPRCTVTKRSFYRRLKQGFDPETALTRPQRQCRSKAVRTSDQPDVVD
jgi:hypothetical protein